MPPVIASKTLAAIEEAFQKDQGSSFRGLLKQTMPTASDAYDTDNTPFRKHLGASLIGRKCSRELWYVFHWAYRVKHNGKTLRLFNRGHLEEPRMIALLLMIGCEVWQYDSNGKQFRVTDESKHFGGSLDAVLRGCPDWPEEAILGEFKTHGDKSFGELEAKGLWTAKWEHYVQMQVYMMKYKLPGGLYVATNKNTDNLYAEIIKYDAPTAERYYDRATGIILSERAPDRLSESPTWYECKFCDFRPICHGKDAPDRNCRTCLHSQPLTTGEEAGKWWCGVNHAVLSPEQQLAGCPKYSQNPQIKELL